MKFNKKGVLGLDIAKSVIVFLLVLAVTAIAVFIVLVPLEATTQEAFRTSDTTNNETLTTVDNVSGETVANSELPDFSMTISPKPVCYNSSNGILIPSTNITATSPGVILASTINCTANAYCGWDWNCTYSYSYTRNDDTQKIVGNITSGTTAFFGYVPTWMILLAVVVLIAIVAIIIVAVSRFEGAAKPTNL